MYKRQARATGVLGGEVHASAGNWPLLALVPAVLVAATGVAVLTVGGRWSSGSRYRSAAVKAPTGPAALPQEDPAAAWDALTRGEDPTADDDEPSRPDVAE